VRQDQLILNLVQLMDRLLKKEMLDLQLTTYKVLATGSSQGVCVRASQQHAPRGAPLTQRGGGFVCGGCEVRDDRVY
jgi:hypothetical protein